ncbi:MAG: selenocysteine lyase/cysteine desulfurase [Patiriisocius sp.]|jgi:selenocysteine lyase/cysteine desulfurase
MENQSHLFGLDRDQVYLNCATKGPALLAAKNAGIEGIETYSNPYNRSADDFFIHNVKLKRSFSKIIHCDDYERIAVIPSVSYGMTNVVNNIPFKKGDNIVIPDGQFPSNVYPWMAIAKEKNLELRIISAPDTFSNRAEKWNEKILDAIDEKTKVLAISNAFWSDGSLFDLRAMRKKTNKVNAFLIIDGTQSVGAMHFSVEEIKPDALICAGYKWLLGPYSIGLAYYSSKFDQGMPIENNWMTRKDSNKFAQLVNYQEEYRPKAFKYSVGESSHFILRPMLQKALDQILDWGVENIQQYTEKISQSAIAELRDLGIGIEEDKFRSKHLFGLRLPKNIDAEKFSKELLSRKIHVAMRGDAVRVSPHVYNTKEDFEALTNALKSSLLTTVISNS